VWTVDSESFSVEPGWYPDPHDSRSIRYWDGSAWTGRYETQDHRAKLRDIPSLAAAGVKVAKARWKTMLALSTLVWSLWASVVAAAVAISIDVGSVSRKYTEITAFVSDPEKTEDVLASIFSINFLKSGGGVFFACVVLVAIGYFLAASVANTALAYQAYRFLTFSEKAGFWVSLRHALKRAAPGSVLISFWYLVCFSLVILGGFIFGVASFFATENAWFAVAASLVGVLGGLILSIWLYTRWSLTGYAVALSQHPWLGLAVSSRITRGSRWGVLGRIVLISLVVSIIVSALGAPFNVLVSFLPFGYVLLFSLLLVRVMLSAVSGVLTGATSTSMYLDLGGDLFDEEKESSAG